ncbi:MAG: nitronate monooxygenase [Thermotogae bacterium]|nr:nitronate monooxygenase [Thermotogota bacterium]
MKINTRITKLLNIKYPVIEGGMAWVGTPRLAAAVSNAGALGTIGSGNMEPEILREKIREIKELTDKPFAVNIIMLNPHAEELLEVVIEERVPIVIFGAGNPAPFVKELKAKNIKVLAVVSSDSLAIRLERVGVDAIIGEGMECGGHIGDVTTLILIQRLTDVLNVPVIAAGGIATGRAIAAMFALGAEGVQLGTAFIATHECEAHDNYKKKVLKAGIRDTVITGGKLGHPARVIKTPFSKKMLEMESSSPEEVEEMLVGSLKKAFLHGDVSQGSFMAGQSAGLIREIKSVEQLLKDLMKETHDSIEKLIKRFELQEKIAEA